MKVLFLVNGSPQSAAAWRTWAFMERLPSDWETRALYRPASKWRGIAPFALAAARWKPQVVYVMDTAYTGVLAGVLATRLTGCRLVTDTGDAAFALAESGGGYSARQLRLIRWVEETALRRSDAMVVRGSYHKEMLEAQGVRHVAFIPDGVDLDVFCPQDASALRAQWGLNGQLVLGMLGTMSWSERHQMCYGWDVVEALGLLKDAPVKALLIGDGDGRVHLEQRARELGVADRIAWAGTLPFASLPPALSAMDICVSTQSNDVVGQVRTTGKLPLYLACGRYVAATDVGEASRVLPGLGGLLPYEGVRDDRHPVRLAVHVRELLACPARLNVCEAARQAAQTHFDYNVLAVRVKDLCGALAVPGSL